MTEETQTPETIPDVVEGDPNSPDTEMPDQTPYPDVEDIDPDEVEGEDDEISGDDHAEDGLDDDDVVNPKEIA